jgi:oligopeptide/dipeptide ABC transporter ATP-binding protein
VMYAGRIVESGTVWDVLERPSHPYTSALLDAIPRIDRPSDGRLTPIEGLPPDPRERPSGCPFRPRCSHAHAACLEEPPLLRAGPDHASACWLVGGSHG